MIIIVIASIIIIINLILILVLNDLNLIEFHYLAHFTILNFILNQ